MSAWLVSGILLLSLLGAVAAVMRAQSRARKLERAFDSASAQLEALQLTFHRFTPKTVVEEILQKGVGATGERREITVLFADLVGFTGMSERLAPEQVVRILNGYFRAMSQAISRHNGHVSKFIGDGLLAIFGAPDPNPWQAMDSVGAAVAMREALADYNKTLLDEGLPELKLSVGIHKGPVVVGLIGSRELLEYTVIGDVVNTASRIEGLTRQHGVDILVSEQVSSALDARFELAEQPALAVKGKAEKVVTFAVRDIKGSARLGP